MRNVTETVKQLIIVNILFFIGTLAVGDVAYKMLAMYFPENNSFQYWQPISHMFMHGGFMHIFFNMFALYSFGSALEQVWGSKKFLFFYISCGLGAALVHTGINYYSFNEAVNTLMANGFTKAEILQTLNDGKVNTIWETLMPASEYQEFISTFLGTVVGASGAIYGVIVAFAFMFPDAELALMFIPVPIKAKYFVPGLVLVDLYLGISGQSIFGGGGIAHFAHVGGALFGFLIMWYWKKNQFNKNRWD
ncbi:rhomboid family intramembrane serine protease [Flavobacterium sp. K5-23]|uniref:rhomboid family intramembrane serine protease n=1 Tax=Flavobacterium sp. K5-23 TaxID=2746225 RepID=UPI0020107D72|nr:rhomboid family intramembrane serine protease [Flavobacterium sp. K5-23]UQD56244.1 rhomboid family intramembrane serine protease [Flavobacterium sp. K5-23]